MKKINYLTSILAIMMGLVLLTPSCKKDDDPVDNPTDYTPVIETDFNFTVSGNTVSFTTNLSGNVWVNNETTSVTTAFEDGACTVFLPKKGDYPFTCQTLVNGTVYKSATFSVPIEKDDLSYLEKGLWKNLSGGVDKTKTWKMDMNAEGFCVYFDGPLYFSGYSANDGEVFLPYWSWDVYELPYLVEETGVEITDWCNWSPNYSTDSWIMAAQDYGTITFNGTEGTVSTEKFGVQANGTFTFDTTTFKMNLTDVTLPTDTARFNEGQVEEWGKIRVFSLTDSAMQLGLKRVYEGFNEDGSHIESKWTLVYNFVVADYEYTIPETFEFEESYNTSFTKEDLVGTYKYAEVPMGWIAWTKVGNQGTNVPAHLYEIWNTTEDVVATLESWGASEADSIFTANAEKVYEFRADGTCTLDGVENTYSVDAGIVTFGTELTGDEFNGVWTNLTGTEVKVLDFDKMGPENGLVDAPFTGIWFGQQNDTKSEYKSVQLQKQ